MTVSQEFTATAAEREQRSVLELFDAIKKDDTAQIKALVALGVPLDVENINGVVPLTFAANIGALASVKTLLEIGAKPDATDSWGRPAAHFAAKREYAEIVKLLPLLPPDLVPLISKPARQPRTSPAFEPESKLLWNAAKRGLADTLALFSTQEIRTNIEDDEGHSLLYHAAASGSAKAVEVLLAAGFDPNKLDGAKMSPLRAAMEGGFADTVNALLEGGADPFARSQKKDGTQDMADIEYASLYAAPEIKKAVSKAAVKFQVNKAAQRGDVVSVKAFMEQGVPADTYDQNGYTALLYATLGRHAEVVKLLLAYKADPNRPWKYGPDLPLHSSVRQGDEQSTAALLESGAKTGIRNSKGLDAFVLATGQENPTVRELVKQQRGHEIAAFVSSDAHRQDVGAPVKASFRRKVLAQ